MTPKLKDRTIEELNENLKNIANARKDPNKWKMVVNDPADFELFLDTMEERVLKELYRREMK